MIYVLLTLMAMQGEATAAPNKPTLELDPPQVMVVPGAPFKLKAKTNATKVFFDTDGIRELPADWPIADRKLCFYGIAPASNGTHTITCTVYVGEEREIRKVLVFVGNNPLPNPGPGPGPKPPVPIDDPLFPELQRLYALESDPNKSDHRDALVGVYEVAINRARKDTKLTTNKALFDKARAIAEELVGDNLHSVRECLKKACAELAISERPLTQEDRDKAAACFERCANMLRALK